MPINIQLKSFTTKTAPVPADIIYAADSANSFDEVQITIQHLIGAYPALLSIGGLTTVANQYIYTTGVDTYAVHAITATPTASILAAWDANANLSANNFLDGLTVIVSAAGTTTLTVASTHYQLVNGSTTQTIVLPVVATLVKGQSYYIINTSSGAVTVNSSGANLVQTMAANTAMLATFNNTAGTAAASWTVTHYGSSGIVLPLSIANGGTSVTAVTTAPAATSWAGWDANLNLSANNFNEGYTTTATAAGTTTLLVGSTYQQFFTGTTTQTVLLPVTSTLVLGMSYNIVNNSTGVVTVQSSGANLVLAIQPGTSAIFTCILTSGTTAASWSAKSNGLPYTGPVVWSPTISFATPGDLSVSYAAQLGIYQRIGNTVILHFTIAFTPTYTTASGIFRITGVPVAASAASPLNFIGACSPAATMTWPVGSTQTFGSLGIGASIVTVIGIGTGITGTSFTTVHVPSGVAANFTGQITYFV